MTVKELIEKLKDVDPELDILIEQYNDVSGNTFGEVKKVGVRDWTYYKNCEQIPTSSWKSQNAYYKYPGWDKQEYIIKPIFYLTFEE